MQGNCEACFKYDILDRAHVKSRGSGGTWDDDNILILCRRCHQMQHYYGFKKFSEVYPNIARILDEKGWEFKDILGVIKLVRK